MSDMKRFLSILNEGAQKDGDQVRGKEKGHTNQTPGGLPQDHQFKGRLVGENAQEWGTLTAADLEVGNEYTLYDEMGQSFKGIITNIMQDGDRYAVQYKYSDDSYSQAGRPDWFDVGADDAVFESCESLEEGDRFSDKVADKIFKDNPNIKDEDELIGLISDEVGILMPQYQSGMMNDADFLPDTVSAYYWMQRNRQPGLEEEFATKLAEYGEDEFDREDHDPDNRTSTKITGDCPEKCYWNNNGKYQDKSEKLEELVPVSGPCEDPELDKFRMISNAYYDVYNNGGWENGLGQRQEQFQAATGSTVEDHMSTMWLEKLVDKQILKAWHEQTKKGAVKEEVRRGKTAKGKLMPGKRHPGDKMSECQIVAVREGNTVVKMPNGSLKIVEAIVPYDGDPSGEMVYLDNETGELFGASEVDQDAEGNFKRSYDTFTKGVNRDRQFDDDEMDFSADYNPLDHFDHMAVMGDFGDVAGGGGDPIDFVMQKYNVDIEDLDAMAQFHGYDDVYDLQQNFLDNIPTESVNEAEPVDGEEWEDQEAWADVPDYSIGDRVSVPPEFGGEAGVIAVYPDKIVVGLDSGKMKVLSLDDIGPVDSEDALDYAGGDYNPDDEYVDVDYDADLDAEEPDELDFNHAKNPNAPLNEKVQVVKEMSSFLGMAEIAAHALQKYGAEIGQVFKIIGFDKDKGLFHLSDGEGDNFHAHHDELELLRPGDMAPAYVRADEQDLMEGDAYEKMAADALEHIANTDQKHFTNLIRRHGMEGTWEMACKIAQGCDHTEDCINKLSAEIGDRGYATEADLVRFSPGIDKKLGDWEEEIYRKQGSVKLRKGGSGMTISDPAKIQAALDDGYEIVKDYRTESVEEALGGPFGKFGKKKMRKKVDKMARDQFDKASGSWDKASDLDWADPDREEPEADFMHNMDQFRRFKKIAQRLGTEDSLLMDEELPSEMTPSSDNEVNSDEELAGLQQIIKNMMSEPDDEMKDAVNDMITPEEPMQPGEEDLGDDEIEKLKGLLGQLK